MADDTLKESETRLLAALNEDDGWVGPTELAMRCWPGTRRHSAYASPILKRLVGYGLVERNRYGHYRIRMNGNRALRATETDHG